MKMKHILITSDLSREALRPCAPLANDVDLIAISTPGRTGMGRVVMGSIAETLLRRSDVPVVVFPRANVKQVSRRSA